MSTPETGLVSSVAQRRWKLVVRELGEPTPLRHAESEASDWMTALSRARIAMGEPGVIPSGASCSVGPDGTVTLLDGVARLQYVLEPSSAAEPPPKPATPTPSATKSSAPAPKRVGKETVAYIPKEHVVSPPKPASLQPPSKISSISPRPLDLSSKSPSASGLPPPKSIIPSSSAPSTAPARVSKRTVAYLPNEEPPPAEPKPAEAPAPSSAAEAKAGDEPTELPYRILYERSVAPNAETPLLYRERTIVVSEGTDPADAERILDRAFETLRAELESQPRGKLVNMAVFDHAWTTRPSRPPLAQLQWKDWKGDPERRRPSAVPTAATPAVDLERATPPLETSSLEPAATAPVAPEPLQEAPQPVVNAPAPSPEKSFQKPVEAPRPRQDEPSSPFSTDDRLSTAFEQLQDLFFLGSPREGAEFVLDLVGELIPCAAGAVAFYDINADELRVVAARGAGDEQLRTRAVPLGVGLLGTCGAEQRPISSDSPTTELVYDETVDGRPGLEVRSTALVPIVEHHRLLGVLQLVNRQRRSSFSSGDMNVLVYVAEKFTEFLREARHSSERIRARR